MSSFINPCNLISRDWLESNGDIVSEEDAMGHVPKTDGLIAVCWLKVTDRVETVDLELIDGGVYESAVIIFYQTDFEIVEEFTVDEKTWFLVDKSKLRTELLQNLASRFDTWMN